MDAWHTLRVLLFPLYFLLLKFSDGVIIDHIAKLCHRLQAIKFQNFDLPIVFLTSNVVTSNDQHVFFIIEEYTLDVFVVFFGILS